MNVSCTLKCFCSQSVYLFFSAPRLLPCFSSVCQPFLLPPLQGLFHLFYLNSLWTPNANSVSHLIRHINSISPLIAVIPLCSEFLLASFQGRSLFFFFFTLQGPKKRIYLKGDSTRNDSEYTGRIMHSRIGLCWLTLWCDPSTLRPF